MKLNGWTRRWILVSAVYLLVVLACVWLWLPTSMSNRGVIYNQLRGDDRKFVGGLVAIREGETFADAGLGEEEMLIALTGIKRTMPNGDVLRFRRDTPEAVIARVSQTYQREI